MTAAVHRLMALNNMKTQNLSPDLLRDFSVEQLTAAFERMKLSDFPYELGVGTTALQKAMLTHEGFLPTLRSLLERGMSAAQVQSLMQTAETLEIPFFELSAEQIFSIQTLNLLSDVLRMQYFRCFGELGLQEPHRSILLDSIQHLSRQREVTFTSMSEPQRALLWKPYFADYVNAFPAHLNAALNILPQNEALQRLMELLFEKKVTLNLLPEHWHALRHTTQRDVDLFGTLLTLLPEREAANGHFVTRWSENGCQTYDLQQMIRFLPEMSAEKVHELFSSLLSYVAGLYGKQLSGLALDSLSHTQSRVLIYAIAKGQKAFLCLIREHFELFKEISDNSMLFSSAFYERIQLNSMNRQNLSDCKHVPAEKLTLDALPETFFTFAELKTLAYAPEHYAKLYRRLMDQGVDRRLLLLRQLLRHRLLSCTLGEDQLDELAARLKEKPFDRWFSEDMGHIKGLRKEDAVYLLSCWSQLRRFIHDMHTSDEACYAIRNRMVLGDYTFWADARGNMVALDQDWQAVCKEFQFTDKFIEANADGVLRFISQEGAAIANAYLNHEMNGHESLRRIVQAEIIGGAILLGACCGLRRSEICGLKVQDIDRKKNTIQVRRTVLKDENGKWIVREGTKTTKSKRKIEVAPFILDALLAIPRDDDFIISQTPDSISKKFIKVRDKLGLSFRFHDLRHYNASIMLALNVPDKYAMERMGYSTPATLKKVYQHTMDSKRQEVTDTINSEMNALFSSNLPS